MKIAITGGYGFLASAIADKLQGKHDITAIYRSGEVSDSVKHICADITDKLALYNALKGFDIIINTAANKYIDRCEQTPTDAINNNIIGAQNVLEVACAYGSKVIHISTDKAVKPNSVYGASKLIAERLALCSNATVVRLCNLKGSTGSIIPKFKRLAAQGLPIVVHGKEVSRYMIDVNVAVEIIERALESDYSGKILAPKAELVNIYELAKSISDNIIVDELSANENMAEELMSPQEKETAAEYLWGYVI